MRTNESMKEKWMGKWRELLVTATYIAIFVALIEWLFLSFALTLELPISFPLGHSSIVLSRSHKHRNRQISSAYGNRSKRTKPNSLASTTRTHNWSSNWTLNLFFLFAMTKWLMYLYFIRCIFIHLLRLQYVRCNIIFQPKRSDKDQLLPIQTACAHIHTIAHFQSVC